MSPPLSSGARPPSRLSPELARAQLHQRQLNERLILACRSRSEPEVKDALALGANPNYQSPEGWIALSACADTGEWEPSGAPIARLLLRAGASPNAKAKRPRGLKTALHLAACGLDYELAGELLKAGADPNARDEAGRAPLHLLGLRRQTDQGALCVSMALTLLEAGAELDLPDCQRVTPLLAAIEARSEELAMFLARRGARLSALCKSASPALHRAAERGRLELCEFFISLGADPFELRENRDAFRLARDCSRETEAGLRALWEAHALRGCAPAARSEPAARPRL